MVNGFSEEENTKIVKLLEYNVGKLAGYKRLFSKDGARFLKKPITPEKHEEWLNLPARIEMNAAVLEKVDSDCPLNLDDYKYIQEMVNTSIKNNKEYMLLFNEDITRFKGKKASEGQLKQYERRKKSVTECEAVIDRLLILMKDYVE